MGDAQARKAAAYDQIARAYRLGDGIENIERCVTEVTFARQLRDEAMRARDTAMLDAARAVDDTLVQIGALEGSSIHAALSQARQTILALWGMKAADCCVDCGQPWSRHGPYQKSHAFSPPGQKRSET